MCPINASLHLDRRTRRLVLFKISLNCIDSNMNVMRRKLLAVWMAVLVAYSLFLDPANAALIVDFEQSQSSLSQNHDHAGYSISEIRIDFGAGAFHEPETLCSSHECMTGIEVHYLVYSAYCTWLFADLNAADFSMTALSLPDSLQRPPASDLCSPR